jgi:hypothetical protein
VISTYAEPAVRQEAAHTQRRDTHIKMAATSDGEIMALRQAELERAAARVEEAYKRGVTP